MNVMLLTGFSAINTAFCVFGLQSGWTPFQTGFSAGMAVFTGLTAVLVQIRNNR